jgi:uncharacterized protein YbjT (DUF2867 family)
MKILIVGATGLVGSEILKLTLQRPEVSEVFTFVRRSSRIVHPKLKENIVDFKNVSSWKDKLHGDVLFSALGTTIKTAGSKLAQFEVDYDFQFNIAAAAKGNGVPTLVLISSTGANPHSPLFYLRTKGLLEEAVKNLSFKKVIVLRPSLLAGKREVPRLGEKISFMVLSRLPRFKSLSTLIPVEASRVAHKAVDLALNNFSLSCTLEAKDIIF